MKMEKQNRIVLNGIMIKALKIVITILLLIAGLLISFAFTNAQ
jgi:hypothetical protein